MSADWKEAASNFPPSVPVDESVVALVRLPLGLTPLHDVVTTLDKHLGPGLVFRTDTGIQGWVVIARPDRTDERRVMEMRHVSKALSRRDREERAILVKRRRKAGLTHSAIDRMFGMPDGWTRGIERYESDPTLSDLRRYEAAIVMAEHAPVHTDGSVNRG